MADPDLQIRGGPGHPGSEIRRGGSVSKKIFRPFGPHFGLKIRGHPAPTLDPPLLDTDLASRRTFRETPGSITAS